MSIFDWSKTASSNGNSDATINFQEGQAPSTVNDSARALMARIAYWRDWFTGNVTQGGSSNAYTITSGESLSAYTAGMRFLWKPNADSTGAVTLNVDAIGAKKVYLPIGTQAVSGSIDADAVYDVIYQAALDSSNGGFKIVGGTLDADLETLAGLTVAADNFIVGNSGGTAWEVKTPANARTSLGLGTAAIVNTGTSGATIPLLNGTNTWSGAQTFTSTSGLKIENSGPVLILSDTDSAAAKWRWISFSGALRLQRDTAGDNSYATSLFIWDASNNLNVNTGTLSVGGSLVWHAGNDGAGSGLDADTLDGVEGSAYAQLSAANVFTNEQRVSTTAPSLVLNETDAGTDEKFWRITSNGGTFRVQANNDAISSFVNAVLISRTGDTITELEVNAPTIDLNGEVQADTITGRVVAGATTSGTLTSASANKTIQLTGDITIDNSVFSAGDIIVMYAGASARTITAGTITTMRLDGTATTGSRTLAARGIAVLFFVSSSEVVVAGGAVT